MLRYRAARKDAARCVPISAIILVTHEGQTHGEGRRYLVDMR